MIAAAPASSKQIGAIHALKARLALDDGSYRDVLQAETGNRSAKGLSSAEAWRVMERLKGLAGGRSEPAPAKPAAEGAQRLEGPYAAVCRALWLAGYNLGVVGDRTDRALVAFVARQTGVDHLNWVRDGADAKKAIEALKSWISREAGGVTWDVPAERLKRWGYSLPRWRKLAVIGAQARRLAELGEHETAARATLATLDEPGLDQLSADLGRRLRKALARREKR
ncbi:regulatory protein GemA [Xanthobacter sp. KR7-225]|uniref:regulatory protein GemA n=1 Tax=Xanthobacter sp. KR7-225 TaxID=3156613 RepID=UPI0032B54258